MPAQQVPRALWPKCSAEKVRDIGAKSKELAAYKKLSIVKAEWEAGVPIKDLSISDNTAYKWIDEGLLKKRKRKVYHKNKVETK